MTASLSDKQKNKKNKKRNKTQGISKLAPGDEGGMEDVIKTAIPIGHMGDKRDIALTCVFLASPTARCD